MAVRTATGGKVDWAPETAPGSGIPGAYVNIPEVRRWEATFNIEAKEYASSSTAGARKRLAGVSDFDLTVEVYKDETTPFDSGTLSINAGDTGFFKCYEDADTFYILPSYVEDTSINVPIEDGDIIEGTISASSNGNVTYP